MLLPLVIVAGAAPVPQDWTRLPRPSLTRPSTVRAAPREVHSGVHLPALDEMDPEDVGRRATEISLATMRELVFGAVRVAVGRADLRVESLGDELLLTGDAEAIEVAREVLAELDAVDRALRLELDAVLVAADGAERRLGRWTGRSGDRAGVGTRGELRYLARYDVNLAADSAAVEPEMGSAWTGTTLHLAAARWSDDAVLVEGHLDVAALAGIETFDPDDVDLGRIELPELEVLEVVFAGFVRAGEPLRVTGAGLPPGLLDGALELRLGPLTEMPGGTHWRALDLAAHAWRSGLPGPAPRDTDEIAPDPLDGEPGPAVAPASLALLLEEGSLDGGPLWSDGLLFVPAAAGERAEALVSALRESAEERIVRASEGGRSVVFPALTNRPVRLVLGREHNRLAGYRAQVAPEAWVLEPRVERRHAGLLLEGVTRNGSFDGRLTARRTVDGDPLPATFTGSSAVQRSGRRTAAADVRLDAGAGGAAWNLDGREVRIEIE